MIYLHVSFFIILSTFFETLTSLQPSEWLQVVPICSLKNKKLEKLYLEVRERHKKLEATHKVKTTHPDIKQRICSNIIKSGWFHKIMGPLNMNKWYRYTQLKIKKPDLLRHLTEENSSTFTYPFEVQTIHFTDSEETVQEEIFLCLGRSKRTVFDLYLSEEYNVNLNSDVYVAGRFIFAKTESNPGTFIYNKFVVTCLAEEPASVVESSQHEMLTTFVESRKIIKTAETEQEDPVCRLENRERSKVCSSVMSSLYFNGQMKYLHYEKLPCQLTEVQHDASEMVLKEWMLTCPALSTKDSRTEFNFFVGRGDKPENVYVYSEMTSKELIHFENISTKIRYILEEKKVSESQTLEESSKGKMKEVVEEDHEAATKMVQKASRESSSLKIGEGSSSSTSQT